MGGGVIVKAPMEVGSGAESEKKEVKCWKWRGGGGWERQVEVGRLLRTARQWKDIGQW